jgi:hypothetical protein
LKGAIERVQDPFQSPGFYSRLYTVLGGRSNRDVKVRIHEIEVCCPHTRVDTRPDGTMSTDSWILSVIWGTSSSVSEVTSTVRDSHLFVSHVRQREAASPVGGISVCDLERTNREGSGSFSISSFLHLERAELPFPFEKQEFVDQNP